ncbi:heavy-metal-associated domain-containing protein, partial [candidate division KSB1 bacterium]|nr:heavy-metal-associated domain-containing protein [candidate division KSB1 bacterium]NIV70269.1 hypothetical protein [Phycisphaerae bacterium]NIS23467.1 heavy-metal-associated domain-containing protein [candidate division KSB1 bacterium]NIT70375.1 heavy-metal-associated domain-containing protein [candidate division KSB1 bacterium]NIU24090.1 heavy-metal-associated domain-containing protein [candidate division KSB1 bacterium]
MKRTVVLTVIILLAAGFMMQSQAQVKQVELRVDGLACPFCAYGLEKKLKQIDGVGKIQINVDKAVVVLENDAGQSVAVEKLESTVTEAGFTPREITATVVGKVSRKDGSPFFSVTGTDVAFILKNNE